MTGNITLDTTVRELARHPAFTGFGQLLLPRPEQALDSMPLRDAALLMPLHRHVQPKAIVSALNGMLLARAAGARIFYPLTDDTRAAPGLFFFRGRPSAPFALICPGGGFAYVGALHGGFPLATEINRLGYNAFVLRYRIGGEGVACQDLAMALGWIFTHAQALGVCREGYSLWGGSAGGRMAVLLGTHGPKRYGGTDLPRPTAVILAYTASGECGPGTPPTYAVIGARDHKATIQAMERRTLALRGLGIDADFHVLPGVGHGFGSAEGTSAQGWLERAVCFWQAHLQRRCGRLYSPSHLA